MVKEIDFGRVWGAENPQEMEKIVREENAGADCWLPSFRRLVEIQTLLTLIQSFVDHGHKNGEWLTGAFLRLKEIGPAMAARREETQETFGLASKYILKEDPEVRQFFMSGRGKTILEDK